MAVGLALMLGVATPDAGVGQVSRERAAPRFADSLTAADTPEAHRADSVSYEIDPFAAVVPFGPGERLEYNVKLGWFNAGKAHLEVLGIDTVRGEPTYHTELVLEGGVLFGAFKVSDYLESWIDTGLIMSRRFISDVREPGYSSYRSFEFHTDEMYWHQTDEDVIGDLATALPQDDVSLFYFIRTLPLVVGETLELSRYFKKDGNPIMLEVSSSGWRMPGCWAPATARAAP